MEKIKMLVVAPYEGLKELVQALSKEYPQFEIRTVVANLEEGAQAAAAGERGGCQIILSRGGTAELIERNVSVPVVGIDISGYDYIRIITLANGFSGKSAMIGYHSITEGAQAIKELMNSPIEIFTIGSSSELPQLLDRLRKEDYRVIVGDVITLEKAREMGFTVILLTSGEESVKKAFAEAEKVYSYIREYRSNLVLLEQALSKTPPYFALLDSSGRAVRYKLPSGQEEDLLRELSASLGDVLRLGSRSSLFRHGGYWSESAERVSDGSGKDFAVFYLSPCPTESEKAPGISVSNEKGPSDFSISTFGRSSVYLKETYEKVRRFARLRVPVLITGEIGTGKDALAKLIHSGGAGSTSFLTLDGASAERSSLESCRQMLQSDETSTLYLRRPNLLDPACRQLLFSMLAVPEFFRSHLVLSSFCESPEALVSSGVLSEDLVGLLGEYRIHLPSLRERPGDMKDLASNYLNEANLQYGKQVVAIDKDAVRLLTGFPWTTNLNQLRRVMFQLVLLAEEPTIRAENVDRVLKDEGGLRSAGESGPLPDKTLDEMIEDIIRRALREENGNLTQVSSRLGVSRSTIWRRMKNQTGLD